MALIKCTECGKDVSSKAKSCPNCGNPINQTPVFDSIDELFPPIDDKNSLKCPKCNNSQWTSNKKGFSGGKAAAGVILTGGIGLLAGTIGSGDVIITCLKCGNKFKAGDYESEKYKTELFSKKVTQEDDDIGVLLLFFGITLIGIFLSYKSLSNDWIFVGIILTIATILCASIVVIGINSANKNKPKE